MPRTVTKARARRGSRCRAEEPQEGQPGLDFDSAANLFIEYLRTYRGYSDLTVSSYRTDLRQFREFLGKRLGRVPPAADRNRASLQTGRALPEPIVTPHGQKDPPSARGTQPHMTPDPSSSESRPPDAPAEPAGAGKPQPPARPLWRVLLALLSDYRGLLALLLVFLIGAIVSPVNPQTGERVFLTLRTQKNILFEYAEYGILAAGMTLVILSAGIDLSVGSVLGFSAMLFAIFLVQFGWPPAVAIVLCLLAGAAIGSVSGTLVARFRVQPFVATLAMMVAARGAAKLVSGGIKVQPGLPGYARTTDPPIFDALTRPLFGSFLPPITLIFLGTIVALWIVVRYTRYGRYLYAIGGNEEAARLSGIRVGYIKVVTYAICGLCAALAGISNAARQTLGDPEAGFTYELDAIAAVVIGGTSLMGGQGGMLLTLVGILILGYIGKFLSLAGAEEAHRLIAKGLIIIIAVLIQRRRD